MSCRTAYLRRALITAMVMLLAGCVPLPVPTRANAPRISSQQVEALRDAPLTRDQVRDRLGAPTLRRQLDGLWIYEWKVERGKWFWLPMMPGLPGGVNGTLTSSDYLLVLWFDGEGMLRNQEYAAKVQPKDGARYCTPSQVCIEHTVYSRTSDWGAVEFDYNDGLSAVTVDGDQRAGIPLPVPEGDACTLLLWPGSEWGKSHGLLADSAPDGLAIDIHDAVPWAVWAWVPIGAYAVTTIPTGTHRLSVFNPRIAREISGPQFWGHDDPHLRTSEADLQCNGGEHLFVEINPTSTRGTGLPIRVDLVDESQAMSQIHAMRRLLNPGWPQ